MFIEDFFRVAEFYPVFLKGIGMTLALSAIGLLAGLVAGTLLGIIRANGSPVARGLVGAYTDLFRGTPFLVQVFIVFFILPEIGIELDPFSAGAIALSNISACFVAEIVASGIRAVPRGQVEAAWASGLTRFQQLRLIVLPQAFKMVIPSMVGQFVLLIKDSSVVSAIGLMDLTRSGWIAVQNVPNGLVVFAFVGVGYFLICYPLIHLSRRLEHR